MNKNDFDRLLRKYYDGQTTEEEENGLADYFAHSDVPDRMLADKWLIGVIAPAEVEVPDNLESRIEAVIDGEDYTNMGRARTIWIRYAVGIAASVALLFAIGRSMVTMQDRQVQTHREVTDAEEAYHLASSTLMEFSDILNEGINYIDL